MSVMVDLYHNRVLELAADIPHIGNLSDAHGSATKVSRICGSTVREKGMFTVLHSPALVSKSAMR